MTTLVAGFIPLNYHKKSGSLINMVFQATTDIPTESSVTVFLQSVANEEGDAQQLMKMCVFLA